MQIKKNLKELNNLYETYQIFKRQFESESMNFEK